jgi:hypothetical protein
VSGPIGLHGGGEFGPDDARFLAALLRAAAASRGARDRACAGTTGGGGVSGGTARGDTAGASAAGDADALRVAILPTAAARSRPDLAVANGRTAFERAAGTTSLPVRVEGLDILEREDAERSGPAGRLAGADVVYLVGGDPGHLLDVLEDSLAWRAILAAHARGAAVAGASAGAMVLGGWTWTPGGPRRAISLVPGVAVAPHFDAARQTAWAVSVAAAAGGDTPGWLGLDEATGVIRGTVADPPEGMGGSGRGGGSAWRVHGPGRARWLPVEGASTSSVEGGAITLD